MARVSVLTLGMGWELTSIIEVMKHPIYRPPIQHLYAWFEWAEKQPIIYYVTNENDVPFMEEIATIYPSFSALNGTHLQDPRSTMSLAPPGSSDRVEQVLVAKLLGIEDRRFGFPPISPENFDREFFPRFNRVITDPQLYYELICVAYKKHCDKKKCNHAKPLI